MKAAVFGVLFACLCLSIVVDGSVEITGARFVERGQSIVLLCNATGQGGHIQDIDWFKDGDIVRNGAGVLISASLDAQGRGTFRSMLTIAYAEKSDGGAYACRAGRTVARPFHLTVLRADTSRRPNRNHTMTAAASATSMTFAVTAITILITTLTAAMMAM